jgi:hypothetical protein
VKAANERPTIAICPSTNVDAELSPPIQPVPESRPVPISAAVRGHSIRSLRFGSAAARGAVAAVVVVTIAVLVATGYSGDSTDRPAAARAPLRRQATPPRVAPRVQSDPTTTVPTIVPVVARTPTGATVSVRVPASLTLRATAPCWVSVTDATGHTIFTTTLRPGQQQQIPIAGSLDVQLGYTPGITMSVDTNQLDLSGLSQTANLTFQTA